MTWTNTWNIFLIFYIMAFTTPRVPVQLQMRKTDPKVRNHISQNLENSLHNTYGPDVPKIFRNFKQSSRVCATSAANEQFLQRCLHEKLLPNFAKVKLVPTSRQNALSIYRFQWTYIRTSLKSARSSKFKATHYKQQLNRDLKNLLTSSDYQTINRIVNSHVNNLWRWKTQKLNNKISILKNKKQYIGTVMNKFPPTSKHQQEKQEVWNRLQENMKQLSPNSLQNKKHYNYSDFTPNSNDTKILECNRKTVFRYTRDDLLNINIQQQAIALTVLTHHNRLLLKTDDTNTTHNTAPNSTQPMTFTSNIKRNDYMPNTLPYIGKLDQTFGTVANRIEYQLKTFMDTCTPRNPHLKPSKDLHEKLKTDIIFVPADKGGANVTMNKSDYISAAEKILNEPSTYLKLNKNTTDTHSRNLTSYLNQLKNHEIITAPTYNLIRNANPRTPKFKIYPKIHKDPLKFRPIVDSYHSFNYYLAKFLVNYFEVVDKAIPTVVKNSLQLKTELLTLPPNTYSTHKMYSLDIQSLYPSVPLREAIEALLELYRTLIPENDPYHNIPEDTLGKLLVWSNVTVFTFNNSHYQQINGLSMGSPISCLLANAFVYQKIESHPKFDSPYTAFYRRYVDDTLLLWTSTEENFQNFLKDLNTIHNNITFTHEKEENQSITFLDMHIQRIQQERFTFSLSKKPYAVINPIDWSSLHNNSQKMGIYKSQLIRTLNISSTSTIFWKTITIITLQFHINNYPIPKLISTLINTLYNYGNGLYSPLLTDKNEINLDQLPRKIHPPNSTLNPNTKPVYVPCTYIPHLSDKLKKI